MMRQAKVAAVSAAALLLSAMPAFATFGGFGDTTVNWALVKGNDVTVSANTGANSQVQAGHGWFSSQRQRMTTGIAVAEGNQTIVVNSNACGCPEGSLFGGDHTFNVATVKYNDVTVSANTGANSQVQWGSNHQSQGLHTGDAGALGNQWIVVNSQGSL